MPALSKDVRDEVEAFGLAVGDFTNDVVRWREFAAQKGAAIMAWPVVGGYIEGYNVTRAELLEINALADALAVLGTEHAAALATLRRLR